MASDPNRPGDRRDDRGAAPPPAGLKKYLPWIVGAALLLLLLLLLSRCGKEEMTAESEVRPLDSTRPSAVELQPGPGAAVPAAGTALTGDLNTRLQQYLASPEQAGRRFTFDDLHFATGSAELPANAAQTVQALSATMRQYPNARVRIEGYADARGSEQSNAQLGARRAEAVARALIGAGVDASRVSSATGSESNPVDTNATPQGQAMNRRTDLVVVSK